ncbi:prolipoprotein diacylglyceryl transferase family protein [Hymenobacter elongatus]|uniref:Diacylglyceryl transferase n=1 Tax=Hymenobacter elongatus TaxID=877208 RepID=A0A4Z0PJ28_9BACT|nr:prolipoprotein diacylglyceryl transferase family protein [Hymenobacter elongatus]TGE14064.1 hypothetical protein E5J99_17575 [Hymenobacter elongatus]
MPPNPYLLFYLLGFALAALLLLWECHRRRYALRPWLLLVAGSVLLLILGTKLITLSWLDWQHLLQPAAGHGTAQRSVLGGMLGAVVGIAVLRRWLGFGRDVFDAFALPFVLGLAVQGVGCWLVGCCFGVATTGPGAVVYAPGTLPFLAQVAQGHIPATAAHTLPLHAVQLYQILLCLGIGAVLGLTRRQPWPAGSRLVLTFGLYAAGRFGLEFWRDPLGDVLGAGDWLGLKPVQVALLLAASGLLGYFFHSIRHKPAFGTCAALPTAPPRRNLLGAVALLGVTALLGPQWLTLPEQLVVKSLLLPLLVVEVGLLLLHSTAGQRLTGLPLGLAALCLLLTSQAPAPPDSTSNKASRTYTSISVGGLTGRSKQYYESPDYGCSGTTFPISTYQQRYAVGSVGVARTMPVGRHGTLTLALDASRGRSLFRPLQDTIILLRGTPNLNLKPYQGRASLYAVSPYIELANPNYFRLGLGLHMGAVAYDHLYEPRALTTVTPQFLFEIGKFSTLYFHLSTHYGLQGLADGTTTVGVGSGFGLSTFRLAGGFASVNSKTKGGDGAHFEKGFALAFLRANLLLNQRWTLEPYATTNFNDVYQLSLQTRYRLPSRKSR